MLRLALLVRVMTFASSVVPGLVSQMPFNDGRCWTKLQVITVRGVTDMVSLNIVPVDLGVETRTGTFVSCPYMLTDKDGYGTHTHTQRDPHHNNPRHRDILLTRHGGGDNHASGAKEWLTAIAARNQNRIRKIGGTFRTPTHVMIGSRRLFFFNREIENSLTCLALPCSFGVTRSAQRLPQRQRKVVLPAGRPPRTEAGGICF